MTLVRFARQQTHSSNKKSLRSPLNWNDSNVPSLGDKLQKLGRIRPFFLIALNQVVDRMLETIADDLNDGEKRNVM
jgi:hypothetical protein